jgi:hypothetical protein
MSLVSSSDKFYELGSAAAVGEKILEMIWEELSVLVSLISKSNPKKN